MADYVPVPGDMIFTYGEDDIISKLIWYISKIGKSKKKYNVKDAVSHMLLYVSPGEIIDIQWNGVIRRKSKAYDPDKYTLRAGHVPSLPDVDQLIHDARQEVGTTMYPLLQLLVVGIKQILGLKKSFDVSRRDVMCTEFIARLYSYQGIELVPKKEPFDVDPIDLLNSKLVEVHNIDKIP